MKLTICYIVLVIVVYLFFRRHEEKDDEKYKYDAETPEGRKERFFSPPKKLSALTKLVIAGFVVIIGGNILMFDLFVKDYWLFFGEKRTAQMEEKYGLIVDYNVDLKKYKRVFAGQSGINGQLEFETDLDGLTFMEKNCEGELIQYAEEDMMYYPQTATADDTDEVREPEEYEMDSGVSGKYWYKIGNREYIMTFYKDGDSYLVKIY